MSDASEPSSGTQFDESGAPKVSRTRRLLKWTGILLVVLAVFVAALPSLLSARFTRGAIASWISENVDREVAYSDLDVSWSDGIRLEGLRVGDDEEDSKTPLLEAPVVVIDAPLLPLLWRSVRVKRFLVKDAVLHVAQREKKSNAEGVLKRRTVKRKRPAAEGPEEESVLPEMDVPVEIRNLTVVFRDREGREARQSAIDFKGRLATRAGPTTFDLNVPDGGGSGVRITGSAVLFEPDGTTLPAAKRKIDATVVMTRLDAAQNRDFLSLFLGDAPAAGTLDGKIETHVVGLDVKGGLDLRLSHLGYGDAAKAAASRKGDDLTLAGTFEKTGDRLRLDGWKVRADGLVLDADLSGGFDSLEGTATLDADLARMAGALRAVGAEFPGAVAGKLTGSLHFTPSPSKGTGDFTLTGLRVEGLVEGRAPVTVDSAQIRFEARPSSDRFELMSLEIKLPDLTSTAHGTRAADGTLDLTAEAKGDLGGVLARVRDLGFLPGQFAVNGDIDAQVHVAGKPSALVVEVSRCVLTEKDARIEVSGRRGEGGVLDFRASGSGDLGNLFGRAAAAGTGPQGIENLKGRFAFEATATGPPDALVLDVPKLHVEGDLNLDAHGKLAADGTIDARVDDLSGRVDDVLLLLRRMALLDRDIALDGRVVATALVRGTRQKPEIPRLTLKMTGGPVVLEVHGSVDAAGAVAAEATLAGDVAVMADVARRAGFLTVDYPLSGQLTAHATASGTRESIQVPKFTVAVANGPADIEVNGAYGAGGLVSATATVSGDLDRALRFAQSAGWMKRVPPAPTGCAFHLRTVLSGPKERIEVPKAHLGMNGPLQLDVDGHMSADRTFETTGKIGGSLQTVLDLATAWSGKDARRLDGTIDGVFAAGGKPGRIDLSLPKLVVRTQGLQLQIEGSRAADGNAKGSLTAVGPLADALVLARSFGFASDTVATGQLDVKASASVAGSKAEASLSLVGIGVVVTKPKFGDGAFREPRLAVTVSSARYDLDAKKLEPVKGQVLFEGARVDVTGEMDGDVVTLEGTLEADQRFAGNHPELLSGASFQRIAGPFQFRGDASSGREKAAAWTGSFALDAKGVTAPHVTRADVTLPGKVEGGLVTIDPIDGTVNGGAVKGRATIGLVGESPEHRLVLDGRDVALDADLAPLLARASPIFAIGEQGKTGGKAGVDLDLTARGFDSAALKKSMTGAGNVRLDGAYVQSTNWIGELLQFVGSSDRLEIKPVKVPFKVHDSMVDTGDVPMEAVGLSMILGGHAGLDGKLDYTLRVKTGGGGGLLSKFGSLIDRDGYVPLRLGGTISDPKLKLPDLKDALKSGLEDLLHRKKDDPDKPEKKDDGDKPRKKKPKKDTPSDGDRPGEDSQDGDPPPPPPPGDAPPTKDDPPPPPPPSDTPPKKEDPPPPPPPGEDPPPPPPPR